MLVVIATDYLAKEIRSCSLGTCDGYRRSQPHYHKRATELYYVLEGEGQVILDGEARDVFTGTMLHIPPGIVHAAIGKMRVLVVGIPDIDDNDVYYV